MRPRLNSLTTRLFPRHVRLAVGAVGCAVAISFLSNVPQAHAAPLEGNRWDAVRVLPATQDNAGQRDPVGALYAAAQNHGVNPFVLINIARLESGFNPYAVGDRGESIGLIQLHRRGLRNHFYRVGYTDPYAAEQAADYLARVTAGEWRYQGVTLRHWTAARILGYA